MRFLDFVFLVIAFAVLFLLITQVLIPAVLGRRLFPAFRTTPLAKQVAETNEQVAELGEAVDSLKKLNVLTQEKTKLEAELQAAKKTDAADSAGTPNS